MEEQRPARPWDLLNKDIGRTEEEIAKYRFSICQTCDKYIKVTHQCKECGCFMNLKVKLPNAFCPIHKWEAIPKPKWEPNPNNS